VRRGAERGKRKRKVEEREKWCYGKGRHAVLIGNGRQKDKYTMQTAHSLLCCS
jgi:hypothetical protein